jgi:F-type H+-transporting ATPase subunit a
VSKRLRTWLIALGVLAVLVAFEFIPGGPKRTVAVADEFSLHPIIKLPKIGPVDLSVTKAVIYLWIALAIIIAASLVVARTLKARPGRFQTAMELLYSLAHDSIAGSVMKSGVDTWFPYIGSVFVYILVCNVIGLIPLPFGDHHQFAFYAATGNLNVTVVLALCTFVLTHYAGVRQKGALAYVKGWSLPSAPPVLRQLIFAMHFVSEAFRLVSLSVRLFANMLAGHAILAVFFAMALLFQSYAIAAVLQAGSIVLFLFEIFIAFIQAFIFAILSAVYIGSALEEEHA